MRTLRDTLRTFAAVIVLLSQPFAFQIPAASQSHSSLVASSDTKPNQSNPKCTDNGTYVNSKGQTVPPPENGSAAPKGATAQCRYGTYSFSKSRRGTCSHQGL